MYYSYFHAERVIIVTRQKPLYKKIYDDLISEIKDGKWKTGEQLPTEKDLTKIYEVSRITSKKALDLLAVDNIIHRIPGRGSFLTAEAVEIINSIEVENFSQVTGLSTDMSKRAQSLECSERKLVGLLMEDFTESFGSLLISGIEKVLTREGYSLILKRSFGKQNQESIAIREMLEQGVDGLMLMPVHGDNYNKEIIKLALKQFPTILIDRSLKGVPLPFVGTDNVKASKELTEYLFEKDHKDIAFISPDSLETSTISDRLSGFTKAHAERGIYVDDKHVLANLHSTLPSRQETDNFSSDIEKIEQYLLNNLDITAVIAVEYKVAEAVWIAAKNIGKKSPEDLEIVCFDGPDSDAGLFPFTHIKQDEENIGKICASTLLEQINGNMDSKNVFLEWKILEGIYNK